MFLTKVKESPIVSDAEDICYSDGGVDDLMQEMQVKRKRIEEGLTKASDDLREQIDDVRLLRQFIRKTKSKIETLQRSKKRTKGYGVSGLVLKDVK